MTVHDGKIVLFHELCCMHKTVNLKLSLQLELYKESRVCFFYYLMMMVYLHPSPCRIAVSFVIFYSYSLRKNRTQYTRMTRTYFAHTGRKSTASEHRTRNLAITSPMCHRLH